MEYKIKKVAMTGGSGGVGLALIKKLLSEKVEILLFQRAESQRKIYLPKDTNLKVVFCSLDELCEYIPEKNDYDIFFHLGWTNTANSEMRNDINKQRENVDYSCDAVELASRLGCHTFIGAGSQAEYGRKDEQLRGDMLCEPETAYGVMKLCACYSTRILCKKYGIRHIWTRILSGYGLYDNENSVLISNILNRLSGKKMEFSKGEQVWDFLYMDDIANALFMLAQKGINNKIYPIASGKSKKLKEYIKIMCDKLDEDVNDVIGKRPYGENQVMHLEADISELKQDTGWEPNVEFEDGIERVINFYKTIRKEI